VPYAPPNAGRRRVECAAGGGLVLSHRRGRRLCGHVRIWLRRHCVLSGGLSKGGDLELHLRRQALPQSVPARGHGGCGAREEDVLWCGV
jgi:hypothetical protein